MGFHNSSIDLADFYLPDPSIFVGRPNYKKFGESHQFRSGFDRSESLVGLVRAASKRHEKTIQFPDGKGIARRSLDRIFDLDLGIALADSGAPLSRKRNPLFAHSYLLAKKLALGSGDSKLIKQFTFDEKEVSKESRLNQVDFDLEELFSKPEIKSALRWQGKNDKDILVLAQAMRLSGDVRTERSIRIALRREMKQARELVNHHAKIVGGSAQTQTYKYVSDEAVELKRMQNQGTAEWEKTRMLRQPSIIDSDDDRVVPLSEVTKGAADKEAARRYAWGSGMIELAQDQGRVVMMVTSTCPGRMHPNPSHAHGKWDGTTPDQAMRWLNDEIIGKVDDALDRAGIQPAGVYGNEPQQDGTPHQHRFLCVRPHEVVTVVEAFWKAFQGTGALPQFNVDDINLSDSLRDALKVLQRKYGKYKKNGRMMDRLHLDERGDKSGATQSMISYLFKYICAESKHGGDAERIQAWASMYGIRRHDFFGMPSKKVWDQMRKMKDEDLPDGDDWREFRKAVKAAKTRGESAMWIELMGGLGMGRKSRPYRFTSMTDEEFFAQNGETVSRNADTPDYRIITWFKRVDTGMLDENGKAILEEISFQHIEEGWKNEQLPECGLVAEIVEINGKKWTSWKLNIQKDEDHDGTTSKAIAPPAAPVRSQKTEPILSYSRKAQSEDQSQNQPQHPTGKAHEPPRRRYFIPSSRRIRELSEWKWKVVAKWWAARRAEQGLSYPSRRSRPTLGSHSP